MSEQTEELQVVGTASEAYSDLQNYNSIVNSTLTEDILTKFVVLTCFRHSHVYIA